MRLVSMGNLVLRGQDAVGQVFVSAALPTVQGLKLARHFAAAPALANAVRSALAVLHDARQHVGMAYLCPEPVCRQLAYALEDAGPALDEGNGDDD